MGQRQIVTIILDCGHSRTWDISSRVARKENYGSHDKLECQICHHRELIHKVIDKANRVSV